MIRLIIKKTIKNYDDTKNQKVRESYGVLAGVLGLVCNIFLFLLKIIVGSTMKSIAIISDGFNNLSDSGASVVSILGAKLSSKKPDKEHPFGHGRFEYISALIVSFIIFLVGFELFKSAIEKIISPTELNSNPFGLLILLLSALIKVWMYFYNSYIAKKISSSVILAAGKDALNDVIATLSIIITTFISQLVHFPRLDGIVGLIVSLLIIKSGFDIAKDTVGVLLGSPPEKETVEKINSLILDGENIVGVHDLIVHDYGPGRVMASVHAEVKDSCDIVAIHEIIDDLEKKIEAQMGIHIVIHMDPISVDCEKTLSIKNQVIEVVKKINPDFNIHDFRMTDGISNINLIFDVEVSADFHDRENLSKIIDSMLKEIDSRYSTVINIDTVY